MPELTWAAMWTTAPVIAVLAVVVALWWSATA
ncbi:hypothetical protein H4W30_004732 [Amycolatopsis roodepoortensis]|uniref:Uncharacterized protein n=1 Tax=Amycolatopsis roodepoortensis TaxID=700274 RepID=A0ABR9LAT3_9PSEU|nr:hypothetical protein [Amycolatopsis roodepoortensis]